MDATISLADLPAGEWTVIARRICRRSPLGDWSDEFDWWVSEGKDGVRAARDAGRLVTVHTRDERGVTVLVAQPVPPKLRPAFAASADRPWLRDRIAAGDATRGNVRRVGVGA